MSFNVFDIDEEQYEFLKTAGESHYFEVKAAISFAPIGKTLSAFANSDGGRLIVGIADPKDTSGQFAGYASQEAANGHVTEITKMFSATPDSVRIDFLRAPHISGLLMDIEVEKSAAIVSTPDQEIYIRRNAQNIRLKAAQSIQELSWKKGQESYENVLTEEKDDFVNDSQIFAEYQKVMVPLSEPVAYIRKEKLARDGRATVAGVMLFDDLPQSTVTQGAVKIYRYRTLADAGEREELVDDPKTIEGPAHTLIYAAVAATVEIIEGIEVLGSKGFEKIKYPREAIHEVICNAIIHRDYSIHDYVHIRVFDNRVEVESPGRFAGHVNADNILSQRFARNKRLVRVLNKFPNPPNKDVGEGLNTAFSSMRNMNLEEPSIEELDNSVRVILAHEPLASKEKIIEEYLRRNKTITNAKGREICFEASESKMRKMFQRMIAVEVLEKVPGTIGRGTRYRLKSVAEGGA